MADVTSAVVAAAEFSKSLLTSLLGTTGNVDRKIAIGLHNSSNEEWNAPRIYFESGTADAGLPANISASKVLLFGARKTDGSFRGTVGVITYYVPSRDVTVALMWSVPYDYNLYSNWWNLAVVSGNEPASESLYNNLYYNWSPHKGDSNNYSGTALSGTWKYEGSMGDSGQPIMDIYVSTN